MGFPLKNLRGYIRKKMEETRVNYPALKLREPRHLVILPSFKSEPKVDVTYPLLEPLVTAHVKWDNEEKKLLYSIVEPVLTKQERVKLEKIESDLTELIDVKISVIKKRREAVEYIEKKVSQILKETGEKMSNEEYIKILYFIIRDFIGLNEIEPLMHDPYIEDIGCTGLKTPVFIVHRRFGSIETSIAYRDLDNLSNFVVKLAERCGRYISYAVPLLDGSLPDGSRIQASLAKDVTTKGPTFSIRKFRHHPFSPVDMVNFKTCSLDMMAYLWYLIQHKASVLICGGVSTGKTSFLNVLSIFIPPEDKIISIEDTREINLPHENWTPSVSRTGFGIPEATGKRYGEIDLFDLLKESFRQNPDYVIVGEVRGKEAYVMFQGMSSGHPSMGTIHAGSVDDVMKRLETPPIELSPSLIESLDLVVVMVHAKEIGKSTRRVKKINEIQSVDQKTGRAHTVDTFAWMPGTDSYKSDVESSEVLHRISFESGTAYQEILKDVKRRGKILEWMQRHNITEFDEVSRLVNLYYKDMDTLMEWVNKDLPPYKTKSDEEVKKLWETSTGLKVIE